MDQYAQYSNQTLNIYLPFDWDNCQKECKMLVTSSTTSQWPSDPVAGTASPGQCGKVMLSSHCIKKHGYKIKFQKQKTKNKKTKKQKFCIIMFRMKSINHN
jgi:hypothetical protein